MNVPNLDQVVLKSLDFFQKQPLQKLSVGNFKLPFVVGSGNALSVGKIIFSQQAAIFSNESSFKFILSSYKEVIARGLITQAVIISASGEKDSVWEIEFAQNAGLETTLLTCKPQSSAAKIANDVLTYKSIAEPYTYNTSTYLGMILSSTQEDVRQIKNFIKTIVFPKNFEQYESYAFILPDMYDSLTPMIEIKRDELFGPHLMIRAYTFGHARHAKFVHPWENELVIALGEKNKYFGHPDHRWNITLPINASYGTIMALTYYLCGKIQAAKHPYFKDNIENFCIKYGPKAYEGDQAFEIIVPANQ